MRKNIRVNLIKKCPECGKSFKTYIKVNKKYCSAGCWSMNKEVTHKASAKKRLSSETMAELYASGKHTLQSIAEISGVTKERVRQLIVLTIGKEKANECKENRRRKPTDKEIIKFNQTRLLRLLKSFEQWHWNYEKCVECGRTDREHNSKGLCSACTSRVSYQTDPDRRDSVKRAQAKYLKKNKKKVYKKNREYYWNNVDKLRAYAREYAQNNKEEANLRSLKGYYKRRNNKEKYDELAKKLNELISLRKETKYEKK